MRTSVHRLARQSRPFEVELAHDSLEAVVGLADARRSEGVRGREVGARLEIAAMHLRDDVRSGQIEQVGIAGDLAGMVEKALAAIVGSRQPRTLEHRPPGAVEDEDPLAEQ